MLSGKLSPEQLQRLVLGYIGYKRSEVLVGTALGRDASIIAIGDRRLVISTDPITGATWRAGWLAIHVAANDIFCSSAEPLCCTLTLLAPPGATEEDISQVMSDASEAALSLGMEICGGHTEVTDAVNKIVISTTMLGELQDGLLPSCEEISDACDIVMTKHAGLEGCAILARDFSEQLIALMSEEEISTLAGFINGISVAKESRIARKYGAKIMHDITEGGVLGALYELSAVANLGFSINVSRIHVHPFTAKLCLALGIDPLRLVSSGSLLIAAVEGDKLVTELRHQGVEAEVIGHFAVGNNKRLLLYETDNYGDCHYRLLEEPKGDALWEAMSLLTKQTV